MLHRRTFLLCGLIASSLCWPGMLQADTRMAAMRARVEADLATAERAAYFAKHPLPTPMFIDVTDHADAGVLLAAFERGWVVGSPDRRFHPEAPAGENVAVVMPPVEFSSSLLQEERGVWTNDQPTAEGAIASALGVQMVAEATPSFMDHAFTAVTDLWQAMTEDDDAHLPSVVGTPLEAFVSKKPFAITMPSLQVADLGIEHPADASDEGALLSVLERGVGHLFAYPGDGGSVFLYGHSSNWPWDVSGFARIFREINRLNVGDRVYVTYENKLFVYQVSGKENVPAGDLTPVQSAGDAEQLVLYTCWPPDDITERYIVRAVPAGVYRLS